MRTNQIQSTNQELIPISEHDGKRAVSARDLHAFLESKQQFANWIENKIKQCGLVKDHDFEVFHSFIKNPSDGRRLTEYALSLSAAKELSMVEGNAKGKQARQYFIDCEKKQQASLVHKTNKMTSLQIAEIAGRPHNDVLKAIRNMEPAWKNITEGNFSLSEYVDSTGRKLPMYELSKTECLYIATKFNDEARAKLVIRWEQLETEKLQPRPLSQIEVLQQSVNMLVAQERRLNIVENRISKLEAKTAARPDYFTIVGYGALHHTPLNLKQAATLGRKAAALCKTRGIETDRIPDPRFGEVKMYPADVLDEIFTLNA